MSRAINWTVARFPNGEWTTGGRPDDPEYEECEVFVVEAFTRNQAKANAQLRRRAQMAKALRSATNGKGEGV